MAELRAAGPTPARDNEAAEKRFFAEVVGTRKATLVPTLTEIEKLAAEPGLKAGSRSFTADPVKELPLLRLRWRCPSPGATAARGVPARVERSKHFVTVDKVQLREADQGDEARRPAEARWPSSVSAWFRAEEGEAVGG